jgi:hypothetical protein
VHGVGAVDRGEIVDFLPIELANPSPASSM